MITEQQILDLGFEELDYSTDIEGVYEFKIERPDISNFPPWHIYRIYWDYADHFVIRGSFERPNKEGVIRRMTKTVDKYFTDIAQLEQQLDIIIRSDMNRYNSARVKK